MTPFPNPTPLKHLKYAFALTNNSMLYKISCKGGGVYMTLSQLI